MEDNDAYLVASCVAIFTNLFLFVFHFMVHTNWSFDLNFAQAVFIAVVVLDFNEVVLVDIFYIIGKGVVAIGMDVSDVVLLNLWYLPYILYQVFQMEIQVSSTPPKDIIVDRAFTILIENSISYKHLFSFKIIKDHANSHSRYSYTFTFIRSFDFYMQV